MTSDRRPGTSGLLIIAYGNDLCGDDGAGPALAHRLEGDLPPGVSLRILHQLTPELSEELSRAVHAVFVDARAPDGMCDARLQPVSASLGPEAVGHVYSPESVVELSRTVFGSSPEAWTLSLPTETMNLGDPLSSTALRGIEHGLALIRRHMRALGYLPAPGGRDD